LTAASLVLQVSALELHQLLLLMLLLLWDDDAVQLLAVDLPGTVLLSCNSCPAWACSCSWWTASALGQLGICLAATAAGKP